jgi:hypothetical protein
MARRYLYCLMMFLSGASLSLMAQADFTATATTVAMAEGGLQDILFVGADNERFSITIPRGYGSQARADIRSIIFTSANGDSMITVRFTTNYAGALPKKDRLSDAVAANHPGASLVSSSVVPTDFGPSQSFDLFQPAANGTLVRIRDAYVAYPEGSVELTFSCNSADFDKKKFGFARLLYSFRLLPKDAKTNP